MGIQLNGTSGTDVISAVDGSLTVEGLSISGDFNIADKIIHTGDTNTSIRFPSADTVTIETAGTERLRITSDGQLIHKANKASGYIAEFHQDHASNSGQILIDSPTNNDGRPAYIELSRAGTLQWSIGQGYNHSGGAFHFATSSLGAGITGSKLTITSAGRLGIGVDAPNARFNLKLSARGTSDFRITDSDTANDVLRAGSQADGDGFFQLRTIAGAGNVLLDSSGVSYITGGNFGVGNSSPNELLSLRHASSNTVLDLECLAANDGSTGNIIKFRGKGANGVSYHAAQIKGITKNGANNAGFLSFWTNSAGTLAEKVRITSDGKIGIGEDDPDGNNLLIRAASTVGTKNGHIMLTGDGATNGEGPQIVFSESGSGSSYAGAYVGHIREGSNSTGSLVFGTRSTGGDVNTVPTERIRIYATGQILYSAQSGDNQITSKRTNTAGSNGNYFFHLKATAGDNTEVGALGFHRDTNTDDSRFVVHTRNTGGSSQERLRIASDGHVAIGGYGDPGSILDVRENKDGAETQIRLFNTDNGDTTTQTAALYLSPDSRGTALTGLRAIKENASFATNAGRDVSLTLNVLQNNSQVEALRITSGGDIRIPFIGNGTGLRQKIQFVTEANYFDEVAYIAMNRTAVSSAPSDMVFATGSVGSVVERLRITSTGTLHQGEDGTFSRQVGKTSHGNGASKTYSISAFYYGFATFKMAMSDGNYKHAHIHVELGGMQYSSGNGYVATVVANGTGNGPSISLNKQDGAYHITVANGGNSNTLYGSWVLEASSYNNHAKPTLTIS